MFGIVLKIEETAYPFKDMEDPDKFYTSKVDLLGYNMTMFSPGIVVPTLRHTSLMKAMLFDKFDA